MKTLIFILILCFSFTSFACEKPKTVKIKSIKAGSLFSKLGFQDGDEISSINGRKFCTTQDFKKLFKIEMLKKNDLKFEILRGGKYIDHVFKVSK